MRTISSANRRLAWALTGGALLVAFWVGREVASENMLPFLAAIGLLAMGLLVRSPILGLYIAYPLMFLVPFGSLWFDFPVFNSPLDIVITSTVGLAAARLLTRYRRLPTSQLYAPMVACAGVLGLYTAIGYGEVTSFRLYRFVQGLWPFILVVLLVDTPTRMRKVLIAALGSLVILSILWLPGLVAGGRYAAITGAGAGYIRSLASPEEMSSIGLTEVALASFGSLGYLTLVAIALAAPVLGSVAFLTTGDWQRRLGWLGFVLCAGAILLSTYGAAVAALLVGTVVMFLLGLRYAAAADDQTRRGHRTLRLAAAIALLVGLAFLAPQGLATLNRLANPFEDASASARISALRQGIGAFLSRPLVGYGAFNRPVMTDTGYWLSGHNSYVVAAYEFGLVYIVPLFLLLLRIGQGCQRLIIRTTRSVERALAIGMTASFVTALITGFLTPVLGEPGQDAVFWFFVGVMTVWNDWLDKDADACLMA
jgi:hypothetical protein